MSTFSILAAAEEHPDEAAIVLKDDVLTFRQVATRARKVMASLCRSGASSAGRVAVVASLRAESLIALYALVELGVPIVLVHPRLTATERSDLLARVPAEVTLDETWTDLALDETREPYFVRPSDEQCLAVVLTSGSSGQAKPVVLSRRAFAAAADASAANLGWRDSDRWLLSMPLAHVGGLGIALRCLAARKAVVIAPWAEGVEHTLEAISHRAVTLASLVPTMLSRIFEEFPGYSFPPYVRALLLGGDGASAGLLAAARQRRVPVLATYGLSETCAQVATQRPGEPPSSDAGVGHPLRGVSVSIDEEEILVRGPTLLTGYLAGDTLVRPFDEGGWLRTGDRGELDSSGRLFVRGRKKDIIVTGGENVDPREVEDVIGEHGSIAEGAVFGVPNEKWGEIVAAAVVPRAGASVDLEALARHLASRLAAYKRPRLVAICDALPVTPSSKVDRRRLASRVGGDLIRLTYPKETS